MGHMWSVGIEFATSILDNMLKSVEPFTLFTTTEDLKLPNECSASCTSVVNSQKNSGIVVQMI